jgi:hypothetical protein
MPKAYGVEYQAKGKQKSQSIRRRRQVKAYQDLVPDFAFSFAAAG